MTTKAGSTPPNLPLISAKPLSDLTPETLKAHVDSMYELRQRGTPKPAKPSYAEGLTVKRTKTGKVSITRNSKKRPFAYVLESEIEALAKGHGFAISDTWNAFKLKGYVIAKTRYEAEKINADIKEIPW